MRVRKISLQIVTPATQNHEIVSIIAHHVTAGNPADYLARLAEKEAAEKVAMKNNQLHSSADERSTT